MVARKSSRIKKSPVVYQAPEQVPRTVKNVTPKSAPARRLYNRDIELLMECAEEELSPAQLEAQKEAQKEHEKANDLIKQIRAGNKLVPASQPNTFTIVPPKPPTPVAAPVPAPVPAPVAKAVPQEIVSQRGLPPPRPPQFLSKKLNEMTKAAGSGKSSDVILIGESPSLPSVPKLATPPVPVAQMSPSPIQLQQMTNILAQQGPGATPQQVYKFVSLPSNMPANIVQNQWALRPLLTVPPQKQPQMNFLSSTARGVAQFAPLAQIPVQQGTRLPSSNPVTAKGEDLDKVGRAKSKDRPVFKIRGVKFMNRPVFKIGRAKSMNRRVMKKIRFMIDGKCFNRHGIRSQWSIWSQQNIGSYSLKDRHQTSDRSSCTSIQRTKCICSPVCSCKVALHCVRLAQLFDINKATRAYNMSQVKIERVTLTNKCWLKNVKLKVRARKNAKWAKCAGIDHRDVAKDGAINRNTPCECCDKMEYIARETGQQHMNWIADCCKENKQPNANLTAHYICDSLECLDFAHCDGGGMDKNQEVLNEKTGLIGTLDTEMESEEKLKLLELAKHLKSPDDSLNAAFYESEHRDCCDAGMVSDSDHLIQENLPENTRLSDCYWSMSEEEVGSPYQLVFAAYARHRSSSEERIESDDDNCDDMFDEDVEDTAKFLNPVAQISDIENQNSLYQCAYLEYLVEGQSSQASTGVATKLTVKDYDVDQYWSEYDKENVKNAANAKINGFRSAVVTEKNDVWFETIIKENKKPGKFSVVNMVYDSVNKACCDSSKLKVAVTNERDQRFTAEKNLPNFCSNDLSTIIGQAAMEPDQQNEKEIDLSNIDNKHGKVANEKASECKLSINSTKNDTYLEESVCSNSKELNWISDQVVEERNDKMDRKSIENNNLHENVEHNKEEHGKKKKLCEKREIEKSECKFIRTCDLPETTSKNEVDMRTFEEHEVLVEINGNNLKCDNLQRLGDGNCMKCDNLHGNGCIAIEPRIKRVCDNSMETDDEWSECSSETSNCDEEIDKIRENTVHIAKLKRHKDKWYENMSIRDAFYVVLLCSQFGFTKMSRDLQIPKTLLLKWRRTIKKSRFGQSIKFTTSKELGNGEQNVMSSGDTKKLGCAEHKVVYNGDNLVNGEAPVNEQSSLLKRLYPFLYAEAQKLAIDLNRTVASPVGSECKTESGKVLNEVNDIASEELEPCQLQSWHGVLDRVEIYCRTTHTHKMEGQLQLEQYGGDEGIVVVNESEAYKHKLNEENSTVKHSPELGNSDGVNVTNTDIPFPVTGLLAMGSKQLVSTEELGILKTNTDLTCDKRDSLNKSGVSSDITVNVTEKRNIAHDKMPGMTADNDTSTGRLTYMIEKLQNSLSEQITEDSLHIRESVDNVESKSVADSDSDSDSNDIIGDVEEEDESSSEIEENSECSGSGYASESFEETRNQNENLEKTGSVSECYGSCDECSDVSSEDIRNQKESLDKTGSVPAETGNNEHTIYLYGLDNDSSGYERVVSDDVHFVEHSRAEIHLHSPGSDQRENMETSLFEIHLNKSESIHNGEMEYDHTYSTPLTDSVRKHLRISVDHCYVNNSTVLSTSNIEQCPISNDTKEYVFVQQVKHGVIHVPLSNSMAYPISKWEEVEGRALKIYRPMSNTLHRKVFNCATLWGYESAAKRHKMPIEYVEMLVQHALHDGQKNYNNDLLELMTGIPFDYLSPNYREDPIGTCIQSQLVHIDKTFDRVQFIEANAGFLTGNADMKGLEIGEIDEVKQIGIEKKYHLQQTKKSDIHETNDIGLNENQITEFKKSENNVADEGDVHDVGKVFVVSDSKLHSLNVISESCALNKKYNIVSQNIDKSADKSKFVSVEPNQMFEKTLVIIASNAAKTHAVASDVGKKQVVVALDVAKMHAADSINNCNNGKVKNTSHLVYTEEFLKYASQNDLLSRVDKLTGDLAVQVVQTVKESVNTDECVSTSMDKNGKLRRRYSPDFQRAMLILGRKVGLRAVSLSFDIHYETLLVWKSKLKKALEVFSNVGSKRKDNVKKRIIFTRELKIKLAHLGHRVGLSEVVKQYNLHSGTMRKWMRLFLKERLPSYDFTNYELVQLVDHGIRRNEITKSTESSINMDSDERSSVTSLRIESVSPVEMENSVDSVCGKVDFESAGDTDEHRKGTCKINEGLDIQPDQHLKSITYKVCRAESASASVNDASVHNNHEVEASDMSNKNLLEAAKADTCRRLIMGKNNKGNASENTDLGTGKSLQMTYPNNMEVILGNDDNDYESDADSFQGLIIDECEAERESELNTKNINNVLRHREENCDILVEMVKEKTSEANDREELLEKQLMDPNSFLIETLTDDLMSSESENEDVIEIMSWEVPNATYETPVFDSEKHDNADGLVKQQNVHNNADRFNKEGENEATELAVKQNVHDNAVDFNTERENEVTDLVKTHDVHDKFNTEGENKAIDVVQEVNKYILEEQVEISDESLLIAEETNVDGEGKEVHKDLTIAINNEEKSGAENLHGDVAKHAIEAEDCREGKTDSLDQNNVTLNDNITQHAATIMGDIMTNTCQANLRKSHEYNLNEIVSEPQNVLFNSEKPNITVSSNLMMGSDMCLLEVPVAFENSSLHCQFIQNEKGEGCPAVEHVSKDRDIFAEYTDAICVSDVEDDSNQSTLCEPQFQIFGISEIKDEPIDAEFDKIEKERHGEEKCEKNKGFRISKLRYSDKSKEKTASKTYGVNELGLGNENNAQSQGYSFQPNSGNNNSGSQGTTPVHVPATIGSVDPNISGLPSGSANVQIVGTEDLIPGQEYIIVDPRLFSRGANTFQSLLPPTLTRPQLRNPVHSIAAIPPASQVSSSLVNSSQSGNIPTPVYIVENRSVQLNNPSSIPLGAPPLALYGQQGNTSTVPKMRRKVSKSQTVKSLLTGVQTHIVANRLPGRIVVNNIPDVQLIDNRKFSPGMNNPNVSVDGRNISPGMSNPSVLPTTSTAKLQASQCEVCPTDFSQVLVTESSCVQRPGECLTMSENTTETTAQTEPSKNDTRQCYTTCIESISNENVAKPSTSGLVQEHLSAESEVQVQVSNVTLGSHNQLAKVISDSDMLLERERKIHQQLLLKKSENQRQVVVSDNVVMQGNTRGINRIDSLIQKMTTRVHIGSGDFDIENTLSTIHNTSKTKKVICENFATSASEILFGGQTALRNAARLSTNDSASALLALTETNLMCSDYSKVIKRDRKSPVTTREIESNDDECSNTSSSSGTLSTSSADYRIETNERKGRTVENIDLSAKLKSLLSADIFNIIDVDKHTVDEDDDLIEMLANTPDVREKQAQSADDENAVKKVMCNETESRTEEKLPMKMNMIIYSMNIKKKLGKLATLFSVASLSKKYSIPAKTVARWKMKYHNEDIAGLQLTEAELKELEEIRELRKTLYGTFEPAYDIYVDNPEECETDNDVIVIEGPEEISDKDIAVNTFHSPNSSKPAARDSNMSPADKPACASKTRQSLLPHPKTPNQDISKFGMPLYISMDEDASDEVKHQLRIKLKTQKTAEEAWSIGAFSESSRKSIVSVFGQDANKSDKESINKAKSTTNSREVCASSSEAEYASETENVSVLMTKYRDQDNKKQHHRKLLDAKMADSSNVTWERTVYLCPDEGIFKYKYEMKKRSQNTTTDIKDSNLSVLDSLFRGPSTEEPSSTETSVHDEQVLDTTSAATIAHMLKEASSASVNQPPTEVAKYPPNIENVLEEGTNTGYNNNTSNLSDGSYSSEFKSAVVKEARKSGFENTAKWYNISITDIMKWHDGFLGEIKTKEMRQSKAHLLNTDTNLVVDLTSKDFTEEDKSVRTSAGIPGKGRVGKLNTNLSFERIPMKDGSVKMPRFNNAPSLQSFQSTTNRQQRTRMGSVAQLPKANQVQLEKYHEEVAGDLGIMPKLVKQPRSTDGSDGVEIASTWKQVQSVLNPTKISDRNYSSEYKHKIIIECEQRGQKTVARENGIPYNEISRWRLGAKNNSASTPVKLTNTVLSSRYDPVPTNNDVPKMGIERTESKAPNEQESLKLKIKLSQQPPVTVPSKNKSTGSAWNTAVPVQKSPISQSVSKKYVSPVKKAPVTPKVNVPDEWKAKRDVTTGERKVKFDGTDRTKSYTRLEATSIDEDADLRMEVINFCFDQGVLKTQKKYNITRQSIIDLMKEYDELNEYAVDNYNKLHGLKTKLVSREKTSVEVTSTATQPVIVKNLNDYIVTEDYMHIVVDYALRHGITAASRKYKRKTSTVKSWMNQFQREVKKKISVEQLAKEQELLAENMSIEEARKISNLEARKKKQSLEAEFRRHIVEFAREFGITAASRRFKKKAATVKSWMGYIMKCERDAKRQEIADIKDKHTNDLESISPRSQQISNSPRRLPLPVESLSKKSPSSHRQKTPQSPVWKQDFVIKPSSSKSPLKLTFSPRRKSSPVIVIGSSTEDDTANEETNDIETDDEQEETVPREFFELVAYDLACSGGKGRAASNGSNKHDESFVDLVSEGELSFDAEKAGFEKNNKNVVDFVSDYDKSGDDSMVFVGISAKPNEKSVKNVIDHTVDNTEIPGSPGNTNTLDDKASHVINKENSNPNISASDTFISATEVPNILDIDLPSSDNVITDESEKIEDNESIETTSLSTDIVEGKSIESHVTCDSQCDAVNLMTGSYTEQEEEVNTVPYEETVMFKLLTDKLDIFIKDDTIVKYTKEIETTKTEEKPQAVIKDRNQGTLKKFRKFADTEIVQNIEETYLFSGVRLTRNAARDTEPHDESNKVDETDEMKVLDGIEIEDYTEEPKCNKEKPIAEEMIKESTQHGKTETAVVENVKKEISLEEVSLSDVATSINTAEQIDLQGTDETIDSSSPNNQKKSERSLFEILVSESVENENNLESTAPTESDKLKEDAPTSFSLFGNLMKNFKLPHGIEVNSQVVDEQRAEVKEGVKDSDICSPYRSFEQSKDRSERNLFDFICVEPESPKTPEPVFVSTPTSSQRMQTRSIFKAAGSPVIYPQNLSPVKGQPLRKPMFKFPKLALPVNFGIIAKLGMAKMKEEEKTKVEIENHREESAIENMKKETADLEINENKDEGNARTKDITEESKEDIVMETFEELRQRLARERATSKLQKEMAKASEESKDVDEVDGSRETNLQVPALDAAEIDYEMYKDFTTQKIVLILDISKRHGIEFASTSFGLPVSVIVNWIFEKDRKHRKVSRSVSLEEKLNVVKEIKEGKVNSENVHENLGVSKSDMEKWEKDVGWLVENKVVCDILEKWQEVKSVANLSFEECLKTPERRDSTIEKNKSEDVSIVEKDKTEDNCIVEKDKTEDIGVVEKDKTENICIVEKDKTEDIGVVERSNAEDIGVVDKAEDICVVENDKTEDIGVVERSKAENICIVENNRDKTEDIDIVDRDETEDICFVEKDNTQTDINDRQVVVIESFETLETNVEMDTEKSVMVGIEKPSNDEEHVDLNVENVVENTDSNESGSNLPEILAFVKTTRPRDFSVEQKAMFVLLVDKYDSKTISRKFGINSGTLYNWKHGNKPIRQYLNQQTGGSKKLHCDINSGDKMTDVKLCEETSLQFNLADFMPVRETRSASDKKQSELSSSYKIMRPTSTHATKLIVPTMDKPGTKPKDALINESKGYRVISPTKLPPLLRDVRIYQRKEYTLEEKVAVVKLVQLYGVRTIHKQFRIPAGSIWNWQHAKNVIEQLKKEETDNESQVAHKELDYDDDDDDDDDDEAVTTDAILDQALVASETTSYLNYKLDQKVNVVYLINHFGIDYFYERIPHIPRGILWNWRHNRHVEALVAEREQMLKKYSDNREKKSGVRENVFGATVDKTDLTEQWLKDLQDRRQGGSGMTVSVDSVKRKRVNDIDVSRKKPKIGPKCYKRTLGVASNRRSLSPSTITSEISVHSNDFEEIMSDDELNTPSVVSKRSETSTQTLQSNRTGKSLQSTSKRSVEKADCVTVSKTSRGRAEIEHFEEIPEPVHEILKFECGEDDRMMICFKVLVDNSADLQQTRPAEIGSKRPAQTEPAALAPPAKKRNPNATEVIDQSGNWVPLDEYYYCTHEGDVSYTEEKGEYRFKCWYCSKMLYNNVRAMQHIQGHIDASKQQNIDLSDLTQCKHCYKQFDTPFEMQTHVEKVHLSNKVLMCRICEKDFSTPRELMAHMKGNHHACEMPYVCHLCSFKSSMYSDVVDHFKKRHDSSHYMLCLYCLRTFEVKFVSQGWGQTQTYYGHLLKHQTKSATKKCVVCRLTFFNALDVKNHRKTCHVSHLMDLKAITQGGKAGAGLKQKRSSDLKSLNAPSISRIQDYRGISMPPQADNAKCVECKMVMSSTDHYKKHVHCSMCRFATSCSVAYANHMMGFHSGQMSSLNLNIPLERPMRKVMYCACGFTSKYGNKVANHLVCCTKWTCYSTKRLGTTVEKNDDDEQDGSLLGMLGLVQKSSVATKAEGKEIIQPRHKMGPRTARRKIKQAAVIKMTPFKKSEKKTMEADAQPEIIDIDETSEIKSIKNEVEAEKTIEEKQETDVEIKEISQDNKEKDSEIKDSRQDKDKANDSEMKGSNDTDRTNQEKDEFEGSEGSTNEKSIAILDEPKQLKDCEEMEDAKPEHSAETEVTEEKHKIETTDDLNKNSPNEKKLVDMEALAEDSEPSEIVQDSQLEREDQKDEAMTMEEDMNTEETSEDTNNANESELEAVSGEAGVTSKDVEHKEMESEVDADDETVESLQPVEEGTNVQEQSEEKEMTQSEAETNEEMKENDHKTDTQETDPELETKTKENETQETETKENETQETETKETEMQETKTKENETQETKTKENENQETYTQKESLQSAQESEQDESANEKEEDKPKESESSIHVDSSDRSERSSSRDIRESSDHHSSNWHESVDRHHSGDRPRHDNSHHADRHRQNNKSYGSNRSDSYHGNQSSYDQNRDRDRSHDRDRDYNRSRDYRDNRSGHSYQDNRNQGYGGSYRGQQQGHSGYHGNREDDHQDRNRGSNNRDRNYNRNYQNRGANSQNYRGGYRGGYY